MIYAAKIKATDSAITVGAYTNKPLCPIIAFENDAERRAELDRIFEGGDGENLIRVTRKQVVGWFGRNFCTRGFSGHSAIKGREVCCEWDD